MNQSSSDACIDLESDTEVAQELPAKRHWNAFAVLFAAQRQPRLEEQKSLSNHSLVANLDAHEHASLPGQYLVPEFISEEEEAELLAFLDSDELGSNPWADSTFNGRHLSKRWGVLTDLKANKFLQAERPMPHIFSRFLDRVRNLNFVSRNPTPPDSNTLSSTQRKRSYTDVGKRIREFCPNEANAIAYHRQMGHSLRNHCDHRSLSGDILVNMSLAGTATMTYCPAHAARGGRGLKGASESTQRVELPRRSLQVQTGTVRYEYTHGIRLEDLPECGRRVSITFRHNVSGFGHYDASNCIAGKEDVAKATGQIEGLGTRRRLWSLVAAQAKPIELD